MILPHETAPLLLVLSPELSKPTLGRLSFLPVSAVLTTGRRTVSNLVRTLSPLADGHPSTYRRVLSSAKYSWLRLACRSGRN